MELKDTLYDVSDRVATITLNRPHRANGAPALSDRGGNGVDPAKVLFLIRGKAQPSCFLNLGQKEGRAGDGALREGRQRSGFEPEARLLG